MLTSKKIGWYRSMCDKIDNENRLWDLAMKVADGGRVSTPSKKDKGGFHKPKKNKLWDELVAEAKVEKQKRLEKERKFNKSRKEKNNED